MRTVFISVGSVSGIILILLVMVGYYVRRKRHAAQVKPGKHSRKSVSSTTCLGISAFTSPPACMVNLSPIPDDHETDLKLKGDSYAAPLSHHPSKSKPIFSSNNLLADQEDDDRIYRCEHYSVPSSGDFSMSAQTVQMPAPYEIPVEQWASKQSYSSKVAFEPNLAPNVCAPRVNDQLSCSDNGTACTKHRVLCSDSPSQSDLGTCSIPVPGTELRIKGKKMEKKTNKSPGIAATMSLHLQRQRLPVNVPNCFSNPSVMDPSSINDTVDKHSPVVTVSDLGAHGDNMGVDFQNYSNCPVTSRAVLSVAPTSTADDYEEDVVMCKARCTSTHISSMKVPPASPAVVYAVPNKKKKVQVPARHKSHQRNKTFPQKPNKQHMAEETSKESALKQGNSYRSSAGMYSEDIYEVFTENTIIIC